MPLRWAVAVRVVGRPRSRRSWRADWGRMVVPDDPRRVRQLVLSARRASIDRAAPSIRRVARNVRAHATTLEFGDEAEHVVALVHAQRRIGTDVSLRQRQHTVAFRCAHRMPHVHTHDTRGGSPSAHWPDSSSELPCPLLCASTAHSDPLSRRAFCCGAPRRGNHRCPRRYRPCAGSCCARPTPTAAYRPQRSDRRSSARRTSRVVVHLLRASFRPMD